MTKPLETQFIIADGAHARWVRRAEGGADFTTVHEIHDEPRAHGEQLGVAFESAAGRRSGIEEKDSAAHAHQAKFAERVAREIKAQAGSGGIERLAIVAPPRTLAEIRRHLPPDILELLVGTLDKDLVKVPDHELAHWLRPLEMA